MTTHSRSHRRPTVGRFCTLPLPSFLVTQKSPRNIMYSAPKASPLDNVFLPSIFLQTPMEMEEATDSGWRKG